MNKKQSLPKSKKSNKKEVKSEPIATNIAGEVKKVTKTPKKVKVIDLTKLSKEDVANPTTITEDHPAVIDIVVIDQIEVPADTDKVIIELPKEKNPEKGRKETLWKKLIKLFKRDKE